MSSQRVNKVDMRRDGHVGKGSRDNLSISWHDPHTGRLMRTQTDMSSPLHFHIADDTPVHVHVRTGTSVQNRPCFRRGADVGLRGAKDRTGKRGKSRAPWIPAGRAVVKERPHRLELQPESEIDDAAVGGPPGGAPRGLSSLGKGATTGETNAAQWATESSPPGTPAPLPADGLVVEDESVGSAVVDPSMMRGKVVECEERLETLFEEVGTLQGEVSACGQVRAHLEDELAHISDELSTSARESARLHRSLSHTRRMSSGAVQKDGLLKKLLEAEKEGEAAVTEAAAMHDVMSHLTQTSSPASAALTRHQEALSPQLEKLQVTAHGLQTLMQQHHGQKVECAPLQEQQDVLLQKLTDVEEGSSQLLKRVHGLEKEINNLMTEVELEKVKVLSSEEQRRSPEVNLAHLQNQLRSKEAENQQQAMQIQALKQGVELHAAEAAEHGKQLCELKEQTRKDRDGLKRAVRVQRQRAEQMEASSMSLQAQLVEKERQMNDALTESEKRRVKHEQASKNMAQMEAETSQLKRQVHNLLEEAKAGRNRLQEKLRKTDQEHESSVVQNNSLQASLIEAEEKLACTQNELQQYTATMRQYENLVEGYKMQVFKTRTEAEESRLKIEELEKENQHLRKQVAEAEKTVRHCSTLAYVHRCSGSGMTCKEQFPDLRPSEQELQESTKQLLNAERRLGHLNENIAELEAKLKQREVEAETRNERVHGLQDENHQLQLRLDAALRQACDGEKETAKKNATLKECREQLTERTKEVKELRQRMESGLTEARGEVEQLRERAMVKEKAAASQISELESEVSRMRVAIASLRREKLDVGFGGEIEEVERRLQSKLQDIRDRLEHAESTIRSLHSYVDFLKASYASVFGDIPVSQRARSQSLSQSQDRSFL
uniref:outer dense fiber protein 2-like isoform X2 n=1 Tax=Myxine glutinosa TaxID=7769 RepID=UPI00358E1095